MPSKYLIVKLAAIGDTIMALPMIRRIREKDDRAQITWVCGRASFPILEKFSIDHLICIDERKLLVGSKIEKLTQVLYVWRKLAFQKFDVIALGHADARYKLLTLPIRSNIFHTFNHTLGKSCPLPGRHHTDEYVHLVCDKMKDPTETASLPSLSLLSSIKERLSEIHQKKIVILAPGGAKNVLANDGIRRWPIENYLTLARKLLSKNVCVIVVGAPSDTWVTDKFAGLDIINLIGETGLLDLIAVFQHSDVIITHDSGPLHLAGLTKTPIIALFGPTNPYEKIPRRNNVHFFWKANDFACCPCYDGKYYADCHTQDCLRAISVSEVLACCERYLKEEDSLD